MSGKADSGLYLKNFIFGVEDSLVSTSGLLSGVAAAGLSRQEIFLSGIVLIFVEAFSMGAGSFLSEQTTNELLKSSSKSIKTIFGGAIMFLSYFFSGFVPLFPYILFEVSVAFYLSILLSLFALFMLGILSARYFSRDYLRYGVRMLLVGGTAIILGIFAGEMFKLPV